MSHDSFLGALLLSFYGCSVILTILIIATPAMRHWFVVPVLGCGVIIGTDVVRVAKGSFHIFEPVAFVGLLGLHFFFFAPLFHVRWDYWALYVTPVDDWKYWLGKMAVLNFFGLSLYMVVKNMVVVRAHDRSMTYWHLNRDRFHIISFACLGVTALLQLYVYYQFGGITGYINNYSEGAQAFQGMGILFAISESFPIVAMMMYVVWAADREKRQTWVMIAVALLTFFVARMLFGGLRGSRSNTILAVFWAAGLIHIWVRPLSRKLLLAGACFALLFMYAYGFYKALGADALRALLGGSSVAELEESTGRTWEALFLGDLGRADIQALIYAHLSSGLDSIQYSYAMGRTYLGALTLVIPSWIWPDRPPTKVLWSTDLLYGREATLYGDYGSSRAHGIAGESMLNFGPLVAPLAYGIFGLLVALAQRWWETLRPFDARLLIAPLVTIFAFYLLVWDSDNIVFFMIKNGLVPLFIIVASSRIATGSGDFRNDSAS